MYTPDDDGGLREYQEVLLQAEYLEWIAAMEAGEVEYQLVKEAK